MMFVAVSMNTTTEMPKRRRFRFSLRTLFVVITVLTVWLGWNVYQVRTREMVRQYIVNSGQGGLVLGPPEKPWKSLPIMWRLLGVEPVQTLRLEGMSLTDEDRKEIVASFPEADIHF